MRIALASERAPKVEAVRAVLSHLAELDPVRWGGCELVARATESGVGDTPMHDDELRLGALRRARALEAGLHPQSRGAHLYPGPEGGVHPDDSGAAERARLRRSG